jgi:DNA-binding response OmpR family regulator
MRILLIEPDRLAAITLADMFKRAGHEVQHAISAQMAVQSADEATPDVVVLEMQLPRHNGVEFLYEFRSYSEWQHIPVIVHSFVPMSELAITVAMRSQLGIARIFYKPATSLTGLCTAVEQVAHKTV